MSGLAVRPEAPADRAAVGALHRVAFGAHGPRVAALVDDLRPQVGTTVSLVAEAHHRVVGHVLLTPCLVDAPRRLVDALVLSPLAVLEDHRQQGVGARLVREAVEAADALRAPLVLLEGDPDYYGRLGFVAADSLGLRRPSLRIPQQAFQARPLTAHERWMTGTMVYPDVWWRHDAVGLRGTGRD